MNDLPLEQHRIAELRRQCRHCNVFPIFLPNTFHTAEPKPVFEVLKPLVEESVDCLKALNSREVLALVQALPPGFRMMLEDPSDLWCEDYLQRVGLYYLAMLVQQDYLSFNSVVHPNLSTSEVLKVYPELRAKLDGDGLLILDEAFQLMDGGLKYRDHILHYHQFLRRSFTSNPNSEFLGQFAQYYRRSARINTFRIAIDHRRIMSIEHYRTITELDTWYGPRFDREDLDNLDKVGLTVVLRARPSVHDLTSIIDRTEFLWKADRKEKLKTFEVEEVSTPKNAIENYVINRYIHAERDIENARIRHFDGAAKVYAESSYSERYDSRMPTEPRAPFKIKLFRIDGDVDIDQWIELTAMFFRGNEMVIRYFDPERYDRLFSEMDRKYKELSETRS